MMIADLPFREVWAVDFEFSAPDGERPKPICLVARELKTGRTIRQWENEFGPLPPYPTSPDSLFVAFYASAEFGCHLALNWPMPERLLTCSPSTAVSPTEFRPDTATAYSGRWPITDSTDLVPKRRGKCGRSRCAVAHGRVGSVWTCSTIASPTSLPWLGFCQPCCPGSICRARFFEVAI